MRTLVRLLPLFALLATVGCNGADPGDRSGDVDSGIEPGSDLAQIQGMWEITAFNAARPGDGPGPEKAKAIRLIFQGNKLTISVGSDYQAHFEVTLHPEANPKRMTVIESDGSGNNARPGTAKSKGTVRATARSEDQSEWLYKFEGETLVLAVADPGQPAPKDFTPRAFGGLAGTAKGSSPAPTTGRVDIIRLKKTAMPAPGGRFGTSRSGTSFSTGPRYSTSRVSTSRSTRRR